MIEYGLLKENELLSLLELYKELDNDDILSEDVMKNIWSKIQEQNIKYFVARDNGNIIASCYVCIISNLTRGGKSIGYIENVITNIHYRRKNIGKTIVENAINYAKE